MGKVWNGELQVSHGVFWLLKFGFLALCGFELLTQKVMQKTAIKAKKNLQVLGLELATLRLKA